MRTALVASLAVAAGVLAAGVLAFALLPAVSGAVGTASAQQQGPARESRLGVRAGGRGLRFRGGRAPSRPLRRSRPLRDVGRGILQALGIAYLLHLLFGWGSGGSPLGLLLLAALIALLAARRGRLAPR